MGSCSLTHSCLHNKVVHVLLQRGCIVASRIQKAPMTMEEGFPGRVKHQHTGVTVEICSWVAWV